MKSVRAVLVPAGVLTILVAMTAWGGTARPGPLFIAGVAVVIGSLGVFGLVLWWLYLSPVPDPFHQPRAASPLLYQITALLALLSGLLLITGGVWDAVWHRRFGGFGDDFLWPPHLLIYGSLALTAVFAIGGLLVALRGQGDLRARFRAAPLPGLLGLLAGYLALSAPSDQLWHTIYGPDLTSWSLPHLMLTFCNVGILLTGAAIQLALMPHRPWQRFRTFDGRELVVVLLITSICAMVVLTGTTEWEGITAVGTRLGREQGAAFRAAFWARPEWLYPVVTTTIALCIGNLALHMVQRPGVATLVGLLGVTYRVGALTAFGAWSPAIGFGVTAHLLLMPPLLALDLWYAARMARADTLPTLLVGNLLAGVASLLVGLPLISLWMVYPRINTATLPPMLGISLVMALAVGWGAARLGAWLRTIGQVDATAERRSWHRAGVAALRSER